MRGTSGRHFILQGGLILLAIGCARDPRDVVDYSKEPIGMQLLRAEPSLRGRKFNTILSFESADDVVFVSTQPPAEQNSHRAHTGHSSLSVGTAGKLKIGSALMGRPFPGDWTLVGGYFFCERAAQITLHLTCGGAEATRTVDLEAGKWGRAFIDLTTIKPRSGANDAILGFTSTQPLLCDDVMLVDNTEWYIGGEDSPWTIKRQGFKLNIERDGWFSIAIDTDDVSSKGWKLEDISTMRATFSSAAGKTKWFTLYSDGRAYWDARYEPLSGKARGDAMLGREHAQPGIITVPEEQGRPDRNSPGDANNDAYNETLGAYEVIATGPRIELALAPRGVMLVRPIVEISGMPDGKPLVTLEGRLVESRTRLKNGNVLIEVPARIERATTLNVRIE